MINPEVIKAILGQFGALVLAVVCLWQIMNNYEQLIDQMIIDHGHDRQLYRESMEQLTLEVMGIRKSIDEIKIQLREIKTEL
jgi:hypothetical protein